MSLRQRLQDDLIVAMKARDGLRVQTIRAVIGAMDNAGAVEAEPGPYEPKTGLGHDVERREVDEMELLCIVRSERIDLTSAAAEYRGLGHDEKADELERRAHILDGYL